MAASTDVRPLVCPLPLSVHYDPATNVNATTRLYTPPPVDKCTSADALGDVVQNAFRLAQGKLQDEICALTKIFIVSDYSWAFGRTQPTTRRPMVKNPEASLL